jgi:hypothetical protein
VEICPSVSSSQPLWWEYSDYATGRTVVGSFPVRGKKFFSSPKRPDRLRGQPSFVFNRYRGSFLLVKFPGRSHWPRGLRRGSTAACLLGLWVRIPPRAWMSVSCECCVLSGRGICDELVPRPRESYRVWCV